MGGILQRSPEDRFETDRSRVPSDRYRSLDGADEAAGGGNDMHHFAVTDRRLQISIAVLIVVLALDMVRIPLLMALFTAGSA